MIKTFLNIRLLNKKKLKQRVKDLYQKKLNMWTFPYIWSWFPLPIIFCEVTCWFDRQKTEIP